MSEEASVWIAQNAHVHCWLVGARVILFEGWLHFSTQIFGAPCARGINALCKSLLCCPLIFLKAQRPRGGLVSREDACPALRHALAADRFSLDLQKERMHHDEKA